MTRPIRIAVCTNRRPEQMAECLAALRRQAGDEPLILVTSGLEPAEAAAHREAFPGTLIEEPQPGLSHARNRALELCADDEVLAFVDDDAVVEPGWWEALKRRWEEAPEGVAVIGGPIRPRYDTPPPRWLSPPLLPALTLLDMGPRVQDLDPQVTTVYGANISFLAGPLRESGGFSPDLGHSGGRLFFSEEDEAQRALAQAGHGVRYVPDVAVLHVIPPERLTRASFLKRRFWYGATLGLRGARPRSLALRQMLSSAAGALVAALARNDRLFMERLVRAAENAGVLAAPVAVRPRSGRA